MQAYCIAVSMPRAGSESSGGAAHVPSEGLEGPLGWLMGVVACYLWGALLWVGLRGSGGRCALARSCLARGSCVAGCTAGILSWRVGMW